MFKPYHIVEIENAMNEQIVSITKCNNEKDKKFFRNEYLRLQNIYIEEIKNWIEIL